MSRLDEIVSEQFARWEQRGRGWRVWPGPVELEPPFEPFTGFRLPRPDPEADDGRKPGFLASLFDAAHKALNPRPPVIEEAEAEPEPQELVRESLVELQTSLPAKLDISSPEFEQFLLNLSLCREPVSFELVGQPQHIALQFATAADDAPLIRRQLQSHFPDALFQSRPSSLAKAWEDCASEDALAVEFGLANEFMLPLTTGKLDPFIGLIGALSELRPNELALFQMLFQPVRHPWAESIVRSVTHADRTPFFVNVRELARAAETKVSRPLFAAVVRIAVKSESFDRTVDIARDLAGSLTVFSNPQGNELIPLENADYPFEEHIEDVLRRQSRRSGMLLNSEELIGFVHLPSSAVRSPALERDSGQTRAAPDIVRGKTGLMLGNNVHAGETFPVRLTPDQRVRHTHIIGVHGTGKTTLLFNMIKGDIEAGEGVAVLDPHGDLTDQILGIIPPERIDDVVLLDLSDYDFPVAFNILSAHSELEKTLLASDLVSIFRRLSTAWGDQMGSVLQNAILAFLESNRGGTLADLRKFLLEPAFREDFLKTVQDPEIAYYWRKGFAQLTGNKSIGPVITRLDEFLAPKPIRNLVSQAENRLDFRHILDGGKIFLAKLPQGQMGQANCLLLGSLLVAKIQQTAMSRQAQHIAARKDSWLYLDEFSNFITPSMAEILTEARKYRLGLILAHQELQQLQRDREVASAVLSHPYTRIIFRVDDADARALEKGLVHFEARVLQNLGTGQAICRVEKADNDFNLSVPFPAAPDPAQAQATRHAAIAASRAKYATPRAQVEAELMAKLQFQIAEPKSVKAKAAPPSLPKIEGTQAPEAPKATVSEKEKPVVPAEVIPPAVVEAVMPVKPPSRPVPEDRGIGGHQHNLIRERIETVARELGFHPHREKPTPTGQKIDLTLERQNQIIACEISIMTPVDYEVGNVAKCLKAGCQHIAAICPDPSKLAKIQKAVAGCLSAEELARVGYYSPDQFLEYLKALKPPESISHTPGTATYGKYKVSRRAAKLTPDELKSREAAAHRVLAKTMKRPKKP